jgi:hypothetical protein
VPLASRFAVRRRIQRALSVVGIGFLPLYLSCSDNPAGPRIAKPAAVVVQSGQDQTGVVGKELASPLVVKVVDEDGRPSAGQLVNFKVTSGGGTVFGGAALTSQSGVAQDRWTLGTSTTDAQTVEARAVDSESGEAIVFAVFHATPKPDVATSLAKVAGDNQQAVAGTPLSDSLAARVADKYGNAVPDVTVDWTIASGGGSLNPTSSHTNAEGLARTKWTLGTQAGSQSVAASSQGLTGSPVVFKATALPGAGTLVINGGNNQTAVAGTAVATPPSVIIRDSNNNPITGVTVTFAVTSGGGSITGPTQITNSDGIAQVTSWTLGNTAGPNWLTATANGIAGSPANFGATGVAGAAVKIVQVGGSNAGTAGAPVAEPPRVLVTDANDNPVAGVPVTFQVASGGGSLSGGSQTTDANGIAEPTSWTLGTTAGSNSLTASSSGLTGSPVTVVATGNPGPAAKLQFVTQPSNTGWRIAISPSVQVAIEDQYSNIVTSSTDRVALTLASNPGGATLTGGGARPFVNGIATFADLTLDKAGSGYSLRADAEFGALSSATSSSFSVSAIGIVTTLERDSLLGVAVHGTKAFLTQKVHPNPGSLFCPDSVVSAEVTGSPPSPVAGGVGFLGQAGRIISDGNYLDALHDCGANLKFGSVVRIEPSSGAKTFVNSISGLVGPDLEFDGTYFYFVAGPQNIGPVPEIRIVRVRASDGDTLVLMRRTFDGSTTASSTIPSIALSGGQLYFIDIPGFGQTIQRVPTNGSGSPTTVVTGLNDVPSQGWRRMVIVGNTIYWAEPGSIRSAPLAGGTATTRVSGLSSDIRSLISDGSHLYINDGSSLRRIDLGTYSVDTIASNDNVGDIALDAEAVYWTSYDTHAVLKKAPK